MPLCGIIVADYPFTTLVPQLGVVKLRPGESFVVADLPGLLEGAAQGVGLGIRFLKHLARTGLLLHLIDIGSGFSVDPAQEAKALVAELQQYSPELAAQPRWLVFSKCELLPQEEAVAQAQAIMDVLDWQGPSFIISALTREGVKPLREAVNHYFYSWWHSAWRSK